MNYDSDVYHACYIEHDQRSYVDRTYDDCDCYIGSTYIKDGDHASSVHVKHYVDVNNGIFDSGVSCNPDYACASGVANAGADHFVGANTYVDDVGAGVADGVGAGDVRLCSCCC